MRALELSKNKVVSISNKATLQQAAILMKTHAVGCLVVVDAQEVPIGLLTDRDMALRGMMNGVPADCQSVQSIMERNVIKIYDTTELEDAIQIMNSHKIRRLVIVEKENGHVCGIVSVDDFLEFLAQEMKRLVEIYSQGQRGPFIQEITSMA